MKVVANSVPKSGTHLLGSLLSQLGFKENPLHLSGNLTRYKSKYRILQGILDLRSNIPPSIPVDLDSDAKPINKWLLKNKLAKVKDMEFCEGHLPYSSSMLETLTDSDFRVLHIERNPMAILYSHYNHVLNYPNYPLKRVFDTLDELDRVKLLLRGYSDETNGYYLASLKERFLNSSGWKKNPKVFFLRFEDLIGSHGGGDNGKQLQTISEIVEFLNLDVNNLDEVGFNLFDRRSETFFKGKINSWESGFSDETIEFSLKELSLD